MKKEILSLQQIKQKTLRMAYQIAEDCMDEEKIILVGIIPKGLVFANLLATALQKILPDLKISIESLKINKEAPLSEEIILSCDAATLANQYIILVDDVMNSGKTSFYGLKPFIDVPIKKLKTAVLVDRKHKKFPVSSDYVGLSLTTTLREHISVDIDGGEICHANLV